MLVDETVNSISRNVHKISIMNAAKELQSVTYLMANLEKQTRGITTTTANSISRTNRGTYSVDKKVVYCITQRRPIVVHQLDVAHCKRLFTPIFCCSHKLTIAAKTSLLNLT